MKTIDQMIDDVLKHEGGYVNDPDDPGGATKYGVTIHTMRRFGVDVNGDGVVDIRDVKALDQATARAIYKREYFEGPRIDDLPEVIQANVFDMFVNSGGNAIKILQRLVNQIGKQDRWNEAPLTVDGVLGPMSIGATHKAAEAAPDHINDAYAIARRNYYFRIGDRRPQSRKYARTRSGGKGGWIKRAEAFMSPKFHMTQAQFDKRVSKW
jgi:lysozyme family protein